MYPNFLWQVDTTKKELFLTFDDGPIPEITEFVLEELNKVEAKGTFFCVGENLEKNPDLSKACRFIMSQCDYNLPVFWKTGGDRKRVWSVVLRDLRSPKKASFDKFLTSVRLYAKKAKWPWTATYVPTFSCKFGPARLV